MGVLWTANCRNSKQDTVLQLVARGLGSREPGWPSLASPSLLTVTAKDTETGLKYH